VTARWTRPFMMSKRIRCPIKWSRFVLANAIDLLSGPSLTKKNKSKLFGGQTRMDTRDFPLEPHSFKFFRKFFQNLLSVQSRQAPKWLGTQLRIKIHLFIQDSFWQKVVTIRLTRQKCWQKFFITFILRKNILLVGLLCCTPLWLRVSKTSFADHSQYNFVIFLTKLNNLRSFRL